jgi:hypothetical protein
VLFTRFPRSAWQSLFITGFPRSPSQSLFFTGFPRSPWQSVFFTEFPRRDPAEPMAVPAFHRAGGGTPPRS